MHDTRVTYPIGSVQQLLMESSPATSASAFDQEWPIPPSDLCLQVGAEDADKFVSVGRDFLRAFRELANLQPHERVLDIGCGCGRMALPLARYLDERGSYEGFDLNGPLVRWCQNLISPRRPSFGFQHTPVRNGMYQPDGTINAFEFRFPYADASFDFAFAASVFTHLTHADMEHYLSETHRVLRPGGRLLATFFLLTPESIQLLDGGKSTLPLLQSYGACRAQTSRVPEEAIGYPEPLIRAQLAYAELTMVEPIYFGYWCGRPQGYTFQDIIVAKRT